LIPGTFSAVIARFRRAIQYSRQVRENLGAAGREWFIRTSVDYWVARTSRAMTAENVLTE
jgi:hypothetical protein